MATEGGKLCYTKLENVSSPYCVHRHSVKPRKSFGCFNFTCLCVANAIILLLLTALTVYALCRLHEIEHNLRGSERCHHHTRIERPELNLTNVRYPDGYTQWHTIQVKSPSTSSLSARDQRDHVGAAQRKKRAAKSKTNGKNRVERTQADQADRKMKKLIRREIKRSSQKSKKRLHQLDGRVRLIEGKLPDQAGPHPHGLVSARFTAKLSPALAGLIKGNGGKSITTNFGKIEHSTILPLDKHPYRFWNNDTSNSHAVAYEYNGQVALRHSGTYLVYAQVLYQESGPRVSFAVRRRDRTPGATPRPLFKCLSAVRAGDWVREADIPPGHETYEMCSSAGVYRLEAGDVLDVMPMYVHQRVVPDGATTFWGFTRLG